MWAVHIYCSLVDNHGDIGVCWRLARQLVREYACAATLWVDDWPGARELIRDLPPEPTSTVTSGVRVRPWSDADPGSDCTGDVLIEGFGCTLPSAALEQLAARRSKPVWINLEYFSAEDWVESFHLGSGWDADCRATRWFFFPGVGPRTGGLLRERDLIARRDAWRAADAEPFLEELGLGQQGAMLKVVCFAYSHAPYEALVSALAESGSAPPSLWLCGRHSQAGVARLGAAALRGVSVIEVPFVSQDDFDRLLWSADVLFVRGEDSLARAVWSGKPFVWHIYPQEGRAHHAKLAAWLARYASAFPQPLREAYADVHAAWNGTTAVNLPKAWGRLIEQWDAWRAHSLARSADFAAETDLTARLVSFVDERRGA